MTYYINRFGQGQRETVSEYSTRREKGMSQTEN